MAASIPRVGVVITSPEPVSYAWQRLDFLLRKSDSDRFVLPHAIRSILTAKVADKELTEVTSSLIVQISERSTVTSTSLPL
jgi:hypothetical protein